MSKNSIDASVSFSYKGDNFNYISIIDIDQLLQQCHEIPSIHGILAKEHGVDSYSYLYEVMQEAEIEFSHPQGYAVSCLIDGKFDLQTLINNWPAAKTLMLLQPIAKSELGIVDLNLHPALKSALVAAYQLGRKT